MKLLRVGTLAVSVMSAIAIAVPTATAHAAPATTAAPSATAAISDDHRSVVVDIHRGTVETTADGNSLRVLDDRGAVVTSLPLAGSIDGFRVPLTPQVSEDGRSVTLTPQVSAEYRSVLDTAAAGAARNPVAKKKRLTKGQRYDIMWKELNKGWKGNTPLFTLIGGLIGFIVFGWIGAAAGAAIGAYIGYGESNPKAWPSVVAWWNTP